MLTKCRHSKGVFTRLFVLVPDVNKNQELISMNSGLPLSELISALHMNAINLKI
jgi:hypothetical protein